MIDDNIRDLLTLEGKVVAKPFSWVIQAGGYSPKVHLFQSAIQIGSETLEGVFIKISYRGKKTIIKGQAEIVTPEKFDCALFLNNHRIAAIDTFPGQRHFNKVGNGLPFFNQTIYNATHRHIWTGEYGYAEPVEPPILDVIELIERFAQECRLEFRGNLEHPLRGEQGELL